MTHASSRYGKFSEVEGLDKKNKKDFPQIGPF